MRTFLLCLAALGFGFASAAFAQQIVDPRPAGIPAEDMLRSGAIYFGLGLFGMIGHYVKKWMRKEIEGSLVDYLFRDHPRETAIAVSGFASAAAGVAAAGGLAGQSLVQIAIAAVPAGYMFDSGLNKGARISAP